ncbi:MAG: acyltransferase [Methylobacteriaceae bacterium]|nr:acyltransferase [Methylobacteriaceae bacterium]
MTQRYLALDGLRGIAAIFVVIYHMGAIESPSYPFSSAYLAVDLFFVLSGFVLSHAYDGPLGCGMTLSQFMARRLARLYPAYLFGLMLGIVALLITADKISSGKFATALITGLALIPVPIELSKEPPIFPLDGPAWSLFLELVVNAAFALFFPRLTRRGLLFIILTSSIILVPLAGLYGNLNLGWDVPNFWGGFPRASFSFFTGILLHRIRPEGVQRFGIVIMCVGILALTLPIPASAHAKYDLAFVLLLAPATVAAGAGLRLSGLLAKLAEICGDISYPLYIIHVPFVVMLKSAAEEWTPLQTFVANALALPLIVTAAWLLAHFYERPVRHYLSSFGERAGLQVKQQA